MMLQRNGFHPKCTKNLPHIYVLKPKVNYHVLVLCVGKTRNVSMGWFLGLGFKIFSDQFCCILVSGEKDGFFMIVALLLLVHCCYK
jgi:hypothetical protein